MHSPVTSCSTDQRREGVVHPNRGSGVGRPVTRLTTFLSLHSRSWLFAVILVGATSCGRLQSAAGAETIPWWLLVIGGIILMAFSAFILKRGVDSPGVTVTGPSGCSKKTIIIGIFLWGGLCVVLGVLSAFFPRLGAWITGYSNIVEALGTAWDVIVFVAIQLFIFGFVVVAIVKVVFRGEPVTAVGVTVAVIWVILTIAYFYWMVSSGRFRHYYVDPFLFLYDFVFGR